MIKTVGLAWNIFRSSRSLSTTYYIFSWVSHNYFKVMMSRNKHIFNLNLLTLTNQIIYFNILISWEINQSFFFFFSEKGQMVNFTGFAIQRGSDPVYTQLCHCNAKAAMDKHKRIKVVLFL